MVAENDLIRTKIYGLLMSSSYTVKQLYGEIGGKKYHEDPYKWNNFSRTWESFLIEMTCACTFRLIEWHRCQNLDDLFVFQINLT